MKREGRSRWVLPALLFLCIALGGSAQGVWFNMALQLAAIAVLAWAFTATRSEKPGWAARAIVALVAVSTVVIAAQLVPLPPELWTSLPGRELVASGYRTLGYPLPALPLSLAPYETVATAIVALPAIAVLIATIRIRQRESWLAASLLAAVFAAVLLGALQVASGGPNRSSWYIYEYSNFGAVGFFANSNHMGSLLLVSIPFAMALFTFVASRARERSPRGGVVAMGAAAVVVIAAGIALNRSLAAVGLAIPVLLFSMLLLPAAFKVRRLALVAGTIALVAGVLVLTGSPISGEATGDNMKSFENRADIWKPTIELIRQTFPFGTGLGSFDSIYPVTEAPEQVGPAYVNSAHNDYLQIVLETGLAGALLIVLFLAWWAVQVVAIWRSALSTTYARAATIASGALLAHSVVDYPLRTAALSAVFAMCLGLMAQSRRERPEPDGSQARPTKHLTLG